jgi:acyl-CoA thioesterase-1
MPSEGKMKFLNSSHKEIVVKRTAFFSGIVGVLCLIGFIIIGCDNDLNDLSSGEYDAARPIVCLGDSITAGFIKGADYPDKSYPAHLQKKVAVEVVNSGVSGDRTTDALSRVEDDVLSKNPQIVIIALGGNDLRAITGFGNFQTVLNIQTVLNSMRTNLETIINRVKDSNRKVYLANYLSKAMISGVASGVAGGLFDEATITGFYNSVSSIYASLAESHDIELIENLITADIYASYMSDPFHPDETGYEMIADIIFDALEPFLLEHNLVK